MKITGIDSSYFLVRIINADTVCVYSCVYEVSIEEHINKTISQGQNKDITPVLLILTKLNQS